MIGPAMLNRDRLPQEPRSAPGPDLADTLESIAATCLRLQSEVGSRPEMVDVLRSIEPVLHRFGVFSGIGLVAALPESLDFEVAAVGSDADVARYRAEVDHQIESGGIGFAVQHDESVVAPAAIAGRWTLLHSIGTPSRVLGVFVGCLAPGVDDVPDAVRHALSIVLMSCSALLEAGKVQRDLADHSAQLDARVEERAQELRALEAEVQAASTAKSSLLAHISHEIRTPLTGIVGMGSLLAATDLDAIQRQQLLTIGRSAKSLRRLSDDILDLARVEAGKMVLEDAPFDLRATLEDIVVPMAAKAAKDHVEVVLQYDQGTPRFVGGDVVRVRQVITNLVGNATRFTTQGQIVVHAGVDGRTGDIRITVEDSGIGIPRDRLEDVFSAFTRVDSSISGKYGGTGMGLSISRQIARLMGGDIHVASAVGVGSTFTFSLRPSGVDQVYPGDTDLAGTSTLLLTRRRALVAATSSVVVAAGGVFRHSPTLDGAQDTIRAIAASGRVPGAVLVDVEWGDTPVAWSLGRLRSAAPGVAMRVIALVPPGDLEMGERLLQAGFDAWIPRPVTEGSVFEAFGRRSESEAAKPMPVEPLRARVLVVDDDPTCATVALMMLEALGCQASFVGTGAEAVRAVTTKDFDLVLMDGSMSDIGGCEATRAIRAQVGSRVPIVALTDSDARQDRQRCLDAGMDDQLPKPFDLAELRSTLAKWVRRPASADANLAHASGEVVPTTRDLPIFDYERAVKRTGGIEDVIIEVLKIFLDGWGSTAKDLSDALAAGDARALRMLAHRIKGGAGSLGAERLSTAAAAAESEWAHGITESASARVGEIHAEFERFRAEAIRVTGVGSGG